MLYSFVLALLLLNPFGEKVSFALINDTSEVVIIAVDNMPEITLPPAGMSDVRLGENEKVYYVSDPENSIRIALFEVDESLAGKQIKLKRLINQAKKKAKN